MNERFNLIKNKRYILEKSQTTIEERCAHSILIYIECQSFLSPALSNIEREMEGGPSSVKIILVRRPGRFVEKPNGRAGFFVSMRFLDLRIIRPNQRLSAVEPKARGRIKWKNTKFQILSAYGRQTSRNPRYEAFVSPGTARLDVNRKCLFLIWSFVAANDEPRTVIKMFALIFGSSSSLGKLG
jgi:hypothetical protein